MMKKILSILLSAILVCTSVAQVFAQPSDIPFEERPFTADASEVKAAIDKLSADLKKNENYDTVLADYIALLEIGDRLNDIRMLNMAELDKLNNNIQSAHSREELNKNYEEAFELINDIGLAVKSILDSSYAEDFKERWGEERTAMVEAYDNEADDTYKQIYDRYYDMLENGADGLEFAKLLREAVLYYRSGTDASTLSGEEMVAKHTKQSNYSAKAADYRYYINKFKNYAEHNGIGVMQNDVSIENPLKGLETVGGIDERFKTAYEYLIRNGLCFYSNEGANYTGVTYYLNTYGDGEIVASGGDDVIGTLIHEFGHFQRGLTIETDAEESFFRTDIDALAELDSQTFELIAMDCYDDIYAANADAMKYQKLISAAYQIPDTAAMAMYEISLYNMNIEDMSDEQLCDAMTKTFGDKWYEACRFYFIFPGRLLQYSLTMFAAVQIYDLYLNDREAGLQKYFEACEFDGEDYEELMDKLSLVSAFDDNAFEALEKSTDNIFKTLFDVDYAQALDYFENKIYLGRVFPTVQRVSVNGGAPETLYAYSSGGHNYIGIRDLAALLNGTSAQFDVEYDAQTATVNMITDKAYTPDGSELNTIPAVETAGQKAAGTYELQRDGETVYAGGMVFVNSRNYFLLRGIAENNLLNIEVGYDAENNIVLLTTKQD